MRKFSNRIGSLSCCRHEFLTRSCAPFELPDSGAVNASSCRGDEGDSISISISISRRRPLVVIGRAILSRPERLVVPNAADGTL